MLTIYRRHKKSCKQRDGGRAYRRCLCPIWVDGLLNGEEIRKSLKTRDWKLAHDRIRQWEAVGSRDVRPAPIGVKEACDKFISDSEARGLREPTIYKYRLLFRQFQSFATEYGLSLMIHFDVDWLRRFRAGWPNKNMSARKKLEALRAFFRFVHESGWIPTNPAGRLKRDKLFLCTAKTGTAVYCPLPPIVIKALNAIPASTYYFWTGLSKPKSAVGDWQRSLKRLFRLAGVPDAHAHRFRDTFSVELLLAGVPIERVSVLLGHQSVRITEKHYAPWVRARQEQLEADVRRTWPAEKPPEEVHTGYTAEPTRVIPLESRRNIGGGGGSRTPVRKALRHEAYMLSSIR